MQPIRIDIPSTDPTRKDVFVCTEFSVSLATKRIVPALHVEQFHRTVTEVPVYDSEGQETGETTTEYGPWEPYRRYHASGQYPVVTHSDNNKQVDAQLNLVPAGTPGALGEMDAIWALMGAPIEDLLSALMGRMILRGNLEDLATLNDNTSP